MVISVLFAVVYTASQGSAVQVTLPDEPHLKSVHVVWQKKNVPAFHVDAVWTTILGVDLDSKPGQHAAEAVLTMDDGRVERRQIVINVAAKKYPTTTLKVAERFVELSNADLARSKEESREANAIY